jgi:hypothetical protein
MKKVWQVKINDGESHRFDTEQEASDFAWKQLLTGEARPMYAGWLMVPVEPVDRSARCTTDGKPLDTTPDDRGQQQNYVILCYAEREKGFVRPVRRTYIHVGIDPDMKGIVLIRPGTSKHESGKACGHRTTMGQAIAETYARDPSFYSDTFCASCGAHYPVGADGEFVWEGTTERVGT